VIFDRYRNRKNKSARESRTPGTSSSRRIVKFTVGQLVLLRNDNGEDVAHGIISQVGGVWHGRTLDEQGLYVVEIKKLNVERRARLPHPFENSGNTFQEAEALNGKMIVAWNKHNIFRMPRNVQH